MKRRRAGPASTVASWLMIVSPLVVAACDSAAPPPIAHQEQAVLSGSCLAQFRSEQIDVLRLDGTAGRVRVPPIDAASWPMSGRVSPDGMFAVGQTSNGLAAVALRGGVLWRLDGVALSGAPAIGPDAKSIAFASGDGRLLLYVVPTRALRRLDVTGSNPSWAPGNDRLAYDDGTRVHVYDLAGATATEIGPGTEPSWAPDGKRLAVRVRSEQIDLVNVETRERQPFIQASSHVSVPRWSADGELMMYTRQGPRHWWSKAQWTGSEPSQILLRDVSSGAEASIGEFYKADPGDYSWVRNQALCRTPAA